MLREKNIAYISKGALRNNYKAIEAHLQSGAAEPPQIIATVKANAYGHGVDIVTEVLGACGCRFFAVSSEAEALQVRQLEQARGRHPRILILGYTFPENAAEMAENDIECTAVSPAHGAALAAGVGAGRLKLHIKLDTGMHRVGFACDTAKAAGETVQDIAALAGNPHLCITGIFSHFACCDDEMLDDLRPVPEGKLTEIQWMRYQRVLGLLAEQGIEVGTRHLANSAAILHYTPAWLDAVRAGILLYGLSPDGRAWMDHTYRPVMQLMTTVAHIQTLRPGEHVGYGATFTATEPRIIATLPIGYADGWIRAYKNAQVTIRSGMDGTACRCPVVGQICMDQCMVDITECAACVQVGDHVVLFGGDDGESVEHLAFCARSIVYEVTCLVSARVPRKPVEDLGETP